MIVLEDRSSWPLELQDLILPHAEQIGKERAVERAHRLEGKSWLATIAASKYESVKQDTATLLKGHTVKAYHCTRLLNVDTVLQEGLLPLDSIKLLNSIQEALELDAATATLLDEANAELSKYIRSNAFQDFEGKLWFYLTKAQTEDFDSQDLFEYFGGRVAREALAGKRFRFYPLLRKLGRPVLISGGIKLADGTPEQLEALATQLVDYLLDEVENWPLQPLKSEFSISTSLNPTDILEVEEWELQH